MTDLAKTALILSVLSFSTLCVGGASGMSRYIDGKMAYEPIKICNNSSIQIVTAPFSTENEMGDDYSCGKFYIFVDSDSNKRIAFTGAVLYNDLIDKEKYSDFRRWLAEFLLNAGSNERASFQFSSLGKSERQGFQYEKVKSQFGDAGAPSSWLYWDIGIQVYGKKTVALDKAVPALAVEPKYQGVFNPEEKESMHKLVLELDRWEDKSLNRLIATMPPN
ncbi:hypothetical protein [Rhizobium halophytocola]|uniref:Secreted protein n=1 Tax=Rhizobium halophytocola TaxID=735519 RepID=A0ABS4E3M9_9HYPH|nr:hypothetical protein [Rhizobium halophytocola]MBP1852514.1 hypothetical protein [Rhizobium halophytocola]